MPCSSPPVLFEEPAGPGFGAKRRCAAVIESAIAVSTLHRDGVVVGACGKWIDIRTIVPSICWNQCGVFSGTITQSPLAILRGVPPSTPDPVRFSALVRFSSLSLPQ